MWHDPRTIRSVSLVRQLFLVALCTLPCTASAQPWADAYRAGDYRTAADLLHPLVLSLWLDPTSAELEPARHLAMLYSNGLGVPRDPILACAFAETAERATQNGAPQYANSFLAYDALVKASEQFVRQHCENLTVHDRVMVGQVMGGCWGVGMPEDVLTVGSEMVRVGRGGIHLADTPDDKSTPDFGCLQIVARLRPLTIAPPADAAPGVRARHFVESLGWQAGQDPGDSAARYVLQWQMYELRGKAIELVATEHFDSTNRWPKPTRPPDFDARFTVEMIRSGHVRWRMDGKPPQRGWVMLPEEKTR